MTRILLQRFFSGKYIHNETWANRHIEMVKALALVDTDAISKCNFTVAVDGINSVGGEIIPMLLRLFGVNNIIEINCESTGNFAHTP